MTIYTYYDPMAVSPVEKDDGLLLTWADSWSLQGWKVRALTPIQAQRHPLYEPMRKKLHRLAMREPCARSYSRFFRWLALENAGGSWLCDYDVINNGFKPQRPRFPVDFRCFRYRPSLIGVQKAGLDAVITALMQARGGSATWMSEDLVFARKFHGLQWGPALEDCVNYQAPGYETAKLVQFSSRMYNSGLDRVTVMREFLRDGC